MQELWNDSFVLFTKLRVMVSQLNDVEAGQLFRAILDYQATGEVPQMDRIIAVVFAQAKADMDYCKEKKDQQKEKASQAGKTSAKTRSENKGNTVEHRSTPLNTVEHRSTPFNHNGDGDVYGDVNVYGDKDTPSPPSGGNECAKSPSEKKGALFDAFWLVYPKKVGKGDARKAFEKIKPSKDLAGRMIAAVQTQSQSEQWKRDHGRYIPNPSTWLNQQRWDDEVPPDMGAPDQKGQTGRTRFANFEERAFDNDDEALGTAWLKKYKGERTGNGVEEDRQ